jgi:hypothetical protein
VPVVLSPRRLEVLARHGQMAWRDGVVLPTRGHRWFAASVKRRPARAGKNRA